MVKNGPPTAVVSIPVHDIVKYVIFARASQTLIESFLPNVTNKTKSHSNPVLIDVFTMRSNFFSLFSLPVSNLRADDENVKAT